MKATDAIASLTSAIIGTINTRANIIAFTKMIEKYGCSYNNKSKLYNQTVYVITLDRLMDEYENGDLI